MSRSTSIARDSLGLGLRPCHFESVLARPLRLDYLEIISDNFIGEAAPPNRWLARVRAQFPVVMHGVGLNLWVTKRWTNSATRSQLSALLRTYPVGEALARLERDCPESARAALVARVRAWIAEGVQHSFWNGFE